VNGFKQNFRSDSHLVGCQVHRINAVPTHTQLTGMGCRDVGETRFHRLTWRPSPGPNVQCHTHLVSSRPQQTPPPPGPQGHTPRTRVGTRLLCPFPAAGAARPAHCGCLLAGGRPLDCVCLASVVWLPNSTNRRLETGITKLL
jgi:hypothetical protein